MILFLQDFSFALKLFNDRILKTMKTDADNPDDRQQPSSKRPATADIHGTAAAHASASSSSAAGAADASTSHGTPIIIVPSALTSVISTLNAVDFLERGEYLTVEEKLRVGAKREQEQYINRLVNGRKMRYKVIDNPKFLKDADWARVVAVFASGQTWQFKEYKWTQPAELFHNVLGVHMTMDDRVVDPNILSWNCKVIKVILIC